MPNASTAEYKIDKPGLKIWIEDDIMYFQYQNIRVTKEDAVEYMKDRLSVCDGKDYLLLVDGTNVRKFDHDARKRMEQEDAKKGIKKVAFVVTSKVQQIMANFFLMINKPDAPLKIFTDKREAVQWLKK